MSWLGLLLVSVMTSLGQLCQKQAMVQSTSACCPLWRNLWLHAGLALMGLALLLWLYLLQQVPLSIAYPMLSLNFVWVNLAAHYWFAEPLSWRHWQGTALILLGITLLGVPQ